MNGIEKITARIETDAVADAARMAEETEKQLESIRAAGEARAQEAYWDALRAGVKNTEDRVQRLAKAADLEARKSILSYKQTIVAEAFDRAEAKLRALTGEEYIAFLAGLAARAAVTGDEEIVLTAADKKDVGAAVVQRANALLSDAGKAGRLTLSEEAGDFDKGLVLKDGNVSVNCTVAALMEQARTDLASSVAAELFS